MDIRPIEILRFRKRGRKSEVKIYVSLLSCLSCYHVVRAMDMYSVDKFAYRDDISVPDKAFRDLSVFVDIHGSAPSAGRIPT